MNYLDPDSTIYETEADLIAEREIMAVVAEAFGYRNYRKNPIKTGFDFSVLGENKTIIELVGLIETKDRPDWSYGSLDRCGGLMISAHKIDYTLFTSHLKHIRLSLAIRLSNKTEVWWMSPLLRRDIASFRYAFFDGNNQPRRNGDREPVYYIPMGRFRRL